jgi:hypothetical protein
VGLGGGGGVVGWPAGSCYTHFGFDQLTSDMSCMWAIYLGDMRYRYRHTKYKVLSLTKSKSSRH